MTSLARDLMSFHLHYFVAAIPNVFCANLHQAQTTQDKVTDGWRTKTSTGGFRSACDIMTTMRFFGSLRPRSSGCFAIVLDF